MTCFSEKWCITSVGQQKSRDYHRSSWSRNKTAPHPTLWLVYFDFFFVGRLSVCCCRGYRDNDWVQWTKNAPGWFKAFPKCSCDRNTYPSTGIRNTLIEKDQLGDWKPEKDFSALQSPRWSFSIKVCYSWVQTIFLFWDKKCGPDG